MYTLVECPKQWPIPIPQEKVEVIGASFKEGVVCTIVPFRALSQGKHLFNLWFQVYFVENGENIRGMLLPHFSLEDLYLRGRFSIPISDIPNLSRCLGRILIENLEGCELRFVSADDNPNGDVDELHVDLYTCAAMYDTVLSTGNYETVLRRGLDRSVRRFLNFPEPESA